LLDSTYIDKYKEHLINERGSSENTVASYMRDIAQFASYLDDCGCGGFSAVTGDDARLFIAHLEEIGRSPATISRSVASLKGFFGYITGEGLIPASPMLGITATTAEKSPPRILTGSEVKSLLEQPDSKDLKCCRDKAMFETLYATGIRVSELVALDESDVNLATGLITCRNGKERKIPIYAEAISAIGKYLSSARPKLAAQEESALFVNTGGVRMSRQGFWKVLKSYTAKLQIKLSITPQVLRNSFAAHLLENGADLHSLQEMLGHADISSTQVFARAVKNQLKDVYNKSHPRA